MVYIYTSSSMNKIRINPVYVAYVVEISIIYIMIPNLITDFNIYRLNYDISKEQNYTHTTNNISFILATPCMNMLNLNIIIAYRPHMEITTPTCCILAVYR